MYIMAYDDTFRSASNIFNSLRAMYHETYSSSVRWRIWCMIHCS